jgi:hypothetical protein
MIEPEKTISFFALGEEFSESMMEMYVPPHIIVVF